MFKPTKAVLHCVVCNDMMENWIDDDIWRCGQCAHWTSTFSTNTANRQSNALDEVHRHAALRDLRIANAMKILEEIISRVAVKNPTLCDVGTAYGWFLSLAQKAGIDSIGIEPDQNVARVAIEQGLPVRVGEFPQCLATSEQFDVLTFNDVFEHLSEPVQILEACRSHLNARGLLVIVLPSSRGILFRIAYQLRRFGIRGPWDRLWQRSFPCPHRHYYSPSGLEAILQGVGFQLELRTDLPSFHYRGLWNRIRMESKVSMVRAMLSYFALLAASPIFRLGRSDITMHIFRSPN